MGKFIDLTKKTFGRLKVLRRDGHIFGKNIAWLCYCSCGKICRRDGNGLRNGNVKSCGCLHSEQLSKRNTKHGLRHKPEYAIWYEAKRRCTNPDHKDYEAYGGRGIKMYSEWLNDFAAFFQHIGPRPKGRWLLDRIDNNGNYEPGNVRWATPKRSALNTRRQHAANRR